MKIEVNPQKDMCSVDTYLDIDIASIALWDSQNKANILSVETGSDGTFRVIVYFNQNLSLEDQKKVYKSEKGILLPLSGKFYLGSPEHIGPEQVNADERNFIDTVSLPVGQYVVDAFSLLIKDDADKPKYLQFALCIFPKEKYTKTAEVELHALTSPIVLKYSG